MTQNAFPFFDSNQLMTQAKTIWFWVDSWFYTKSWFDTNPCLQPMSVTQYSMFGLSSQSVFLDTGHVRCTNAQWRHGFDTCKTLPGLPTKVCAQLTQLFSQYGDDVASSATPSPSMPPPPPVIGWTPKWCIAHTSYQATKFQPDSYHKQKAEFLTASWSHL